MFFYLEIALKTRSKLWKIFYFRLFWVFVCFLRQFMSLLRCLSFFLCVSGQNILKNRFLGKNNMTLFFRPSQRSESGEIKRHVIWNFFIKKLLGLKTCHPLQLHSLKNKACAWVFSKWARLWPKLYSPPFYVILHFFKRNMLFFMCFLK